MESIVHSTLAGSPFKDTVRSIEGVLESVVAASLGETPSRTRAEWSLRFEKGEPRVHLVLSESRWNGTAEGDFDPAELSNVRKARSGFLDLWSAVLSNAMRKQMKKLDALELEASA
ncbi:MAG: hypothetical protein K2X38_03500 [Gemmataceae bacterium]|nr:hypothetical protein [Gemmataceae bacterium]